MKIARSPSAFRFLPSARVLGFYRLNALTKKAAI